MNQDRAAISEFRPYRLIDQHFDRGSAVVASPPIVYASEQAIGKPIGKPIGSLARPRAGPARGAIPDFPEFI